jgi:hypothetical protein
MTTLTRFAGLAAIVAAAAIAAGATATSARADQWQKTYQISGRANLAVTTGDGDVTIASGGGKQIVAKVTTQGWKIGPNDIQIVESQSGDQVSIEVKFPHWNWSWGGLHNKSVHVDLQVPSDLDANIRTGDGNIEAQHIGGNLEFNTGDGNITTAGVKGTSRLRTGDGNVTGQDFDGTLEASSGDGNLSLRGRFDAINVKSGDGNVDIEAGAGSKVAQTWSVQSGDGHITLRVPPDLQADLEARTGDGSVTLDIPVQVSGSLSHSSVSGKMNGGGGEISLHSGDGSIHLEKI